MPTSTEFLRQPGQYEQAEGPTLKVRATKLGYYEFVRRRPGDVFTLKPRMVTVYDASASRPQEDKETGKPLMRLLTAEEQFSPRWMERVGEDEPERFSTSQEAINQQHDELSSVRRPRRSRE